MFGKFFREVKVEAYKKAMTDAIINANSVGELACGMLKVNKLMSQCTDEMVRGKLTHEEYREIRDTRDKIRKAYTKAINETYKSGN